MDEVSSLIILLILFILSAFFSSAETAFSSVSHLKLDTEAKQGGKLAQKILDLTKDPRHFLTVILLGNNIVNIAAALLSGALISSWIKHDILNFIVTTFGVTFVILIFGEIIPKSLATHYSLSVSKKYYRWIRLFEILTRPIVAVINLCTAPILNRFGDSKIIHMSEDDLKYMLETSKEQGVLDHGASEIISNAFDFKDINASEILTPRVDIFRLNAKTTINEAITASMEGGFSRVPIIEESVDKIIGIAYLKDMFNIYMNEENDASKLTVREIMRKPFRIPEDKKIHDLLIEMKQSHIQVAIVLDEYGGTAGMVTIEDILEEIVGEIRDEYDTEQDDIIEHQIESGTIITTGRADIGELNDRFDLNLPEDDYETIGGLVFNELGREVKVGDSVIKDQLEIVVEKMEETNITRLVLQPIQKIEQEDE